MKIEDDNKQIRIGTQGQIVVMYSYRKLLFLKMNHLILIIDLNRIDNVQQYQSVLTKDIIIDW